MTPLLLDAAMGTALLDAGLGAGSLPERWVMERPDVVAAVHRAHADAGAQVVLTCTFNLAGPRLRESGLDAPVEEIAARAVDLARSAAPRARIAGAVGPAWLSSGPDRAEWAARHGRALRALADAGADLLWSESHWVLEEARVALAEGRRTGRPIACTFGFRNERGALRAGSGEPGLECLSAIAAEGASAVGANCSLPGDPLRALVAEAASRIDVPIIAKPSAGLPGSVVGPEPFAAWILDLLEAGAAWVGGCCGASAAHVDAIRRRVLDQRRG